MSCAIFAIGSPVASRRRFASAARRHERVRRESGRVLEEVREPAFAQRGTARKLLDGSFFRRVVPDVAYHFLETRIGGAWWLAAVFCAA